MSYVSTKTFAHNLGLSCCFRQWRASSHCRFLHGYALEIMLTFQADILDANGWVVDFGSLKSFKALLETMFDHKLLVAEDDPDRSHLEDLERAGLASIVVVPATGCEAFAALIYHTAKSWLLDNGYSPRRVTLTRVDVREHGANSASYFE